MTEVITCLKHNNKIYITGEIMDVHLNYIDEPVVGRLVHISKKEIEIDCSSEYRAMRTTIPMEHISRIVSTQGTEVKW